MSRAYPFEIGKSNFLPLIDFFLFKHNGIACKTFFLKKTLKEILNISKAYHGDSGTSSTSYYHSLTLKLAK